MPWLVDPLTPMPSSLASLSLHFSPAGSKWEAADARPNLLAKPNPRFWLLSDRNLLAKPNTSSFGLVKTTETISVCESGDEPPCFSPLIRRRRAPENLHLGLLCCRRREVNEGLLQSPLCSFIDSLLVFLSPSFASYPLYGFTRSKKWIDDGLIEEIWMIVESWRRNLDDERWMGLNYRYVFEIEGCSHIYKFATVSFYAWIKWVAENDSPILNLFSFLNWTHLSLYIY